MSSEIGRRGVLGVGLEADPGITTAIDFFIPYLSCDLNERHTPIADLSAKGIRDEQGADSVEGKKWGEGPIEVVLAPKTAPIWLAMALGQIDSTTSGSIEYHVISRKADNPPLTATIYRNRIVDEVKFPYSAVNTLELSFADDVGKISVDILSRYAVVEGDTPTFPALDIFTFEHAYVELTNDGTTSELKVREFTLSIDNKGEVVHAPNDNDADRIVFKGFEVKGSIVIDFESTTQRNVFRDLDKQKLVVTFTKSTSKIKITIPRFRVDPQTIALPNDDTAQETINFIAEWNAATTSTINIVVENEVPLYKVGY